MKGSPERKEQRDARSGYNSCKEDPAAGPGPVGKQNRVPAGCGRNAGGTGKPLEIPLFVLQKWRR